MKGEWIIGIGIILGSIFICFGAKEFNKGYMEHTYNLTQRDSTVFVRAWEMGMEAGKDYQRIKNIGQEAPNFLENQIIIDYNVVINKDSIR